MRSTDPARPRGRWFARGTRKRPPAEEAPRAELPARLGGDATTEVSYAASRSDFTDGDLLCFRGKGFVSWLIRALTRSPYSHVGLVYWFEKRVYCIEAVASGVRLILMSELEKRYAGGIDYFAVREVTKEVRCGALSFAFQRMGMRYDKPAIVRFLWFLLTGLRPKVKDDDRWFCSEMVAAAYRSQQVSLVDSDAAYTSPRDLAESKRLKFRFTVCR